MLSVMLGIAGALLVVVQATLVAAILSRTMTSGAGCPHLARRAERCSVSRSYLQRSRDLGKGCHCLPLRCGACDRRCVASCSAEQSTSDRDGRQRAAPVNSPLLATKGLDAVDGYFARYLPQLILGLRYSDHRRWPCRSLATRRPG